MTFNCKIIAAVLYFCVCAVKMWDQEEMPCTTSGLERRTKSCIWDPASWCELVWAQFLSEYSQGTPFPTKILPSSAAQQCWRPEASYTLHRTVPLSTCCWLGELVLLQCHPYVNSTLRKAAAAQLGQGWGPPAVIKVKLKASKEVYPCTNGVPSGLCADVLLVSNPSWAYISSPPPLGDPFLIFFILCF